MLGRASISLALVNRLETAADAFKSCPLHLGIHGGVDFQPPLVELILTVFFLKLDPEVFEKIGRLFIIHFFQGTDHNRGPAGMVSLGLGDVPLLDHPLKHISLAFPGFFHVLDRRIGIGCFGEAGQHGHFGQVELLNIFAEICLGSDLNTVGATAEINLVQIEVENLVLGELLFHPLGQNGLLDLAGKFLFRGQEHRFGHLLGDR